MRLSLLVRTPSLLVSLLCGVALGGCPAPKKFTPKPGAEAATATASPEAPKAPTGPTVPTGPTGSSASPTAAPAPANRTRTGPAEPDKAGKLVKLDEVTAPPEVAAVLARLKTTEGMAETEKQLIALRDKGAVPALLGALGVNNPNVRSQAAVVLRRMGEPTPEVVAALTRLLLSDPDPDVRGMMAKQMEFLKDPSTVPAIMKALVHDAEEAVRQHCALALGVIGDQEGVEALIFALDDPSTEVRLYAAGALKSLKNMKAAPHLAKRMTDPNPLVRQRVQEALFATTGKQLGKDADPWLKAYPLPGGGASK